MLFRVFVWYLVLVVSLVVPPLLIVTAVPLWMFFRWAIVETLRQARRDREHEAAVKEFEDFWKANRKTLSVLR